MASLNFLPWHDWWALAMLMGLWLGYAWFARRWARSGHPTLLATTNRYRYQWMLQTSSRDPRMFDGVILQNLSHTPSFFSSTSLIIIGGIVAVLGTTDKAVDLIKDMPFAQNTSLQVFEIKLLVLLGVFVYSFFRFSWSMRQYTFVGLLIGAMPFPEAFAAQPDTRAPYVERAAAMISLAAETFNDGLRAYYFAFAVLAWFVSPAAMALAACGVVWVLYRREFRSEVLSVLTE